MRTFCVYAMAVLLFQAAGSQETKPDAQERKPVPKDSVRVFVPGCSKGYIFTAGRPAEDQPGGTPVPDGMHLRMAGPKKLMADIKGQEGSKIEITGIIKRGQVAPGGVGLGGGVSVSGGPSGVGGGIGYPAANQIVIDVEGWRRIPGDCPSR
jgi:hypothetical protein